MDTEASRTLTSKVIQDLYSTLDILWEWEARSAMQVEQYMQTESKHTVEILR